MNGNYLLAAHSKVYDKIYCKKNSLASLRFFPKNIQLNSSRSVVYIWGIIFSALLIVMKLYDFFNFFGIRLQEHICGLFFLEPMSSSFPNWTGPKKKGRNKLRDQRLFIY